MQPIWAAKEDRRQRKRGARVRYTNRKYAPQDYPIPTNVLPPDDYAHPESGRRVAFMAGNEDAIVIAETVEVERIPVKTWGGMKLLMLDLAKQGYLIAEVK